ncbi:MAG: dicarboxylate/amino acid:cation symporter [Rickettsiales bacterium]
MRFICDIIRLIRANMTVQVLLATILGVVAGVVLGENAAFLKVFGITFIKIIIGFVGLLVFVSIINSIGKNRDISSLGKTLGIAVTSFLATSLLALIWANLVAGLWKVGDGVSLNATELTKTPEPMKFELTEFVLQFLPSTNPIDALGSGNMIQVIWYAALIGIAAMLVLNEAERKNDSHIMEVGNVFFAFTEFMDRSLQKILIYIVKFAPLGAFGSMAYSVGTHGAEVLIALSQLTGAVILAIALHQLLITALVKYTLKMPPLLFAKSMLKAQLVAFSSSSSAATLPVTIKVLTEKLGVPDRIATSVAPLGATVNMDGTLINIIVSTIFIANVMGHPLDTHMLITVSATSLMASVATAAVPGASLIMLATVLTVAGLPVEAIGIILAVDRILDMVRTACNIYTDGFTAVLVARMQEERKS